MNAANLLARLKGLKVGDTTLSGGILKDVSMSPQSIATTGTRATAENSVPADAIVLDAANEDAIVNFTVPRDYDEGLDHLKIVLLVAHVSGTSIDLQADSVSKGSPTEIYADLATFTPATATTINATVGSGGNGITEVEADLSSLSLERHDNIAVNFIASNVVSVGVAHVLGARVEYRSALVSYDEEDASGNNLR